MTDQKKDEDLNILYGEIMNNQSLSEVSNWSEINTALPTDEKVYRQKAISSFSRFNEKLEAALQN